MLIQRRSEHMEKEPGGQREFDIPEQILGSVNGLLTKLGMYPFVYKTLRKKKNNWAGCQYHFRDHCLLALTAT